MSGSMMAFRHPCTISSGTHCINVTLADVDSGPVTLYVVPALFKQAIAAGAKFVGDDGEISDGEVVAEITSAVELSKHENIVNIISTMVEENNPEHFGGNGVPLVSAVSEKLGDRVTRDELTRAWRAFRNQSDPGTEE